MSLASNHPSAFIDKESLDTIRRASAEAETLKDLHPDQLDLIHRNGWFKTFIPKTYGGLGWSLPAVLKVEESLSWADGSTGWVVTLCSGAGWFTGFLQPSLLKEILKHQKVCFAGSGAATGVANLVDGRYEVTGSWRYASGSLHASVFTANCRLHENGLPLHHKDGSPLISAFLFLKEEVTLQREWKSIGMIATASHSLRVTQLIVPSDRCFNIDAKDAVMEDPIYQYPFLQLAETTLTINLSGMAMRFLDLCDLLFSEKMRRAVSAESTPDLFELLKAAGREMDQCRLRFYTAVEASWEVCEKGTAIPAGRLDEVSSASNLLAQRSRQIVDTLYPYCGLRAANPGEEINRVWRNIHTASQHALFTRA